VAYDLPIVVDPVLRRKAQMQAIRAARFDFETFAHIAAGDEAWAYASEAQRAELTTLLRKILARTYLASFAAYVGRDVRWIAATELGELSLVHTEARWRTVPEPDASLTVFFVQLVRDEWRVVDVFDRTNDDGTLADHYHVALGADRAEGDLEPVLEAARALEARQR
jgi:hypothetical protein